jgi:pyrimidine-nucleoside phosphorylase/thymidine phosphorylase
MSFVDVIARKRDGHALSQGEIQAFVAGLTAGKVPDYQISALLMAITLRGMTDEETSWLTDAMVRSGDRVDLSDIPGIKVGKHSTGGVGDKVSLILAPLAAACGTIVPKMSGRGLGHTGGTLDKLESIPGFRVDLPVSEFKRVIRAVGTSIIGQTASLAPADRSLYALRDVTATVESIPLISASIMSKKLAEGSDALVLDVKCGDGAFIKDVGEARVLAATMVAIGARAGVRTEAFVTDMDAPLGMAVGNALEVAECIATLKGGGPPDLRALVIRLTARMLVLGGVESDPVQAEALAERALDAGQAAQVFARLIDEQGGDPRVIDDPARLPTVDGRQVCVAARAGYVQTVRAEAVGRASHALGAGRSAVGDAIDHGVGIVMRVRPGDPVERGQPVLELHHRAGRGLEDALALCGHAVVVSEAAPPAPRPAVLGEIR